SNRGGMVKKTKKCSTTAAAITMRDNNQNPFFDVIMTKTYADGKFLRIPGKFSREHLNNFQGIATLFVGEEMAMEVNIRSSIIGTGWKLFSEKNNLQVHDVCSNREGIVKKAKKCSTTAATVTMRDNNENPFFQVIMTKAVADGTFLRIPGEFSREHLNKFQGIATLFVGEEMAMEVNMREERHRRKF
ncbi:B3 DNA-binding domain protein, partial [Trifolium medium]|nr:B3 DNA-binding domain protein [Trifolium medium]